MSDRPFTVLDLFCGAGGLSRGFEEAGGYRIVAANDCWGPAIETYKANFPHVKFIAGSIAEPAVKQQIVDAFGGIGCDVIIGGPSCQAYSLAGRRDPLDPRARLFEHYVDVVSRLRPKMFLMENVPGILSIVLDGKPVVDRIRDDFKQIGYDVTRRMVNSADYGVPQLRERVIFLGAPSGMPVVFPAPTHGDGEIDQ